MQWKRVENFAFRRPPGFLIPSETPSERREPLGTTTRTETIHSSNAMSGKKARARKQKRERRIANTASTANAGEAIPGLLNDIVVTHVLRSEYFDARRSRTAPSGEPRDARRGGGNGASV